MLHWLINIPFVPHASWRDYRAVTFAYLFFECDDFSWLWIRLIFLGIFNVILFQQNMYRLGIKYQSYPKLRKINAFEQKYLMSQSWRHHLSSAWIRHSVMLVDFVSHFDLVCHSLFYALFFFVFYLFFFILLLHCCRHGYPPSCCQPLPCEWDVRPSETGLELLGEWRWVSCNWTSLWRTELLSRHRIL